MCTFTISGLNKLQSNKLAMMFESDDEFIDYINETFEDTDLPKIQINTVDYDRDGDNIVTMVELDDEGDRDREDDEDE